MRSERRFYCLNRINAMARSLNFAVIAYSKKNAR